MDESNPRSEEGFVLVEEPSQPDSTNLEPPNSLEDGVQTVVGTAGTPDPSNPSVLATSKPMATESFEMSGSADIGRARKRPPAHYKYKQPSEDEERLEKLFRDLDVTKDGRVDVKDLTQGLKNMGIPLRQSDAIDMVRQGDQNASGDLDFAEFLHYMVEHEKRLKLVFSALDRNHDGRLDKAEIMTSFKELGITLSETEAVRLLARIDRDGSLDISFKEWRDFLLFHPSGDIRSILAYWSHPPILDIGEAIDVPEDFTEGELSSGLWWRHLVAGGLAGAVSRTATAPLDRLKVFLQVHGVKQFGTLRGCMRHMVLEGGIAGLWRGNGVNILKIAPESALKFMAYEQTKRYIRGEQPRDMFIYERLVAGSFAGAFSQSVIYPLEVLKTRLALRKTGEFRGILDAAFKIYSKEGVRSFYRGYVPNLIGIMPYAGIELAVYETLKGHFMAAHPGHDPGVSTALICATTSSTCGQVCAYPFALIRTKLQAQAVQINVPSGPGGAAASTAAAATASAHPATMREVVRHTLQNEGWTGLYRGIVPNFLKVLPAVSISFVVYEKSRAALGVTMT